MVDPKSDFERHEGWRETLEFIEPRVKKFLFSLNRIGYLTHLASVDLIPAKSREEILRSVVVFTHATLEDFLRTIGRAEILRNPRPDFLSKVSLACNGQSLQKEKFTLNELMVHRAKTVQEVLDESVNAHLQKLSFSTTTEIASFLEMVGIEVTPLKSHFEKLAQMISRRHQIVHRADFPEGMTTPEEINEGQVSLWLATTKHLCEEVLNQLLKSNVPKAWTIQQHE